MYYKMVSTWFKSRAKIPFSENIPVNLQPARSTAESENTRAVQIIQVHQGVLTRIYEQMKQVSPSIPPEMNCTKKCIKS